MAVAIAPSFSVSDVIFFLSSHLFVQIRIDMVVATVEHIVLHEAPGAILIFMTGW